MTIKQRKRTSARRKSSGRPADLEPEVRQFLARQITALRGEMSQAAFGKLIGKPQSVVSRLEDPNYGKVTLQTLLEIAAKLDVSLIVRFANHVAYRQLMVNASPEPLQPRRPSRKVTDHSQTADEDH